MDKADEWAAKWDIRLRSELGLTKDLLRPEGIERPSEMTDLTWSARKIDTLLPQFKERFWDYAYAVDSVAGAHGVDYIIWCGVRSVAKQLQLYRQGRTTPGPIVTKTIAGGRHMFGCAIDWCLRTPKGQPNFKLPLWHKTEVLALARPHGLRSLYIEKGLDKPHVEAPSNELPKEIKVLITEMKKTFPGI